jgi:hypothetical protein
MELTGYNPKRPLEYRHSLIPLLHNPNNPTLFTHVIFGPNTLGCLHNSAPERAKEAYIPVSTVLCFTFFMFCEKLISNDKLSNLNKIFKR